LSFARCVTSKLNVKNSNKIFCRVTEIGTSSKLVEMGARGDAGITTITLEGSLCRVSAYPKLLFHIRCVTAGVYIIPFQSTVRERGIWEYCINTNRLMQEEGNTKMKVKPRIGWSIRYMDG
jgi:hypothetical protein